MGEAVAFTIWDIEANLVSFTRLSHGLTVQALADLVEAFEAATHDVIAEGGGRVVKTLGDEVLFVADEPAGAAGIACNLVTAIGEKPDMPDIRVGLATGPVVARFGDVFGTPTNFAARLTAMAHRDGTPQHRARRRRARPPSSIPHWSPWVSASCSRSESFSASRPRTRLTPARLRPIAVSSAMR